MVAQPRQDINYAALVADDFSFEPPRRRGRKIVVALLLLGGAAGAFFAFGSPGKSPAPTQEPPVLAMQPPQPAPTETAAPAPTETAPEPAASAAEAPPSTESPPSKAPGAAAEPLQPIVRSTRPASPASRPSHPTETIEEPDEPDERPSRASSLKDAIAASESRKSDAKPSEEKSSDTPQHEVEEISDVAPFDRGAAVTALGAAAGNAQSCKMLGGPTGSGQATVTFAPSGRVTSAGVSGDFAGSSVGSCVAKLFRNARVPAFSGGPVTVTKRFSID